MLLNAIVVGPNVFWKFKKHVIDVFAAKAGDECHANLLGTVFGTRMHQLTMPKTDGARSSGNFDGLWHIKRVVGIATFKG